MMTAAGVGLVANAGGADAGVVESLTEAVSTVLGDKPSRRCWRNDERCWIEVRGLADTETGDRLGVLVVQHVLAQPGVLSATLNYPLSRVVVRLDGDAAALPNLCDAVAAAEEQAGVTAAHGAVIDLPADAVVVAGQLVATAATAVGLAVALAGRALLWPRLPGALNAAVTLVDYQPRLRRIVEDRFGAAAADAALALAAAAGYTLTQAPASLAVDLFVQIVKAAERQSAAQTWTQREPVLAGHADCADGVRPSVRPRPRPAGPVERHGDRSGIAQLVGSAAAGLLTGDLAAAATAVVVAAPKAARNSREAFAATLGRGLADDHGVLTLRPAALRSLDRVDAVVVDPRALCGDDLQVGRIRGVAEADRAAVWRWAQTELIRGSLPPGWHSAVEAVASNGNACAGEVLVRNAHHPLAAAVLGELRRGGTGVVSLDVDILDDLRSSFDDLVAFEGAVDDALAAVVGRLQQEGHTVAVISAAAAQALADADVAIGMAGGGAVLWHADLVSEDLAGVWRVLHALPAARQASRRGVEIAAGASLLGALLMIPGVRGRGPGPVTAGAGAGAWSGFTLARGVFKSKTPAPVVVQEWHAMSPEQVRRLLPTPPAAHKPAPRPWLIETTTTASGLARSVVEPLRRSIGDFVGALREELSDPLTPVLAVGAAASAVLGSPVDAVLVGSVLAGNAMLAATQRIRAERLLRRLLAVQDPLARTLIDGANRTVASADLRLGDLIEVRPGEVVAADARLIEAVDLEVDESSLTGESLPATKQTEATPAAAVADRACMLHATTTVVSGKAVAVVTAVGAQTQADRAVHASQARGVQVGLQSQLRDMTNRAWPLSLAGGALVTGLGLLRLTGLRQAVSSGVAVSVAAVPEGLPLVATLAQQASARRLTRTGALVRTPRSVEALGRVDVVCFDKTGTLSENRLRVARVEAATGGSDGDVLRYAGSATPPANGDRHEHATDSAIAEAAHTSGAAGADAGAVHLPFRSGRPFSAAISGRQLFIKGAPEVVLAACHRAGPGVQRQVRAMASDGLRVIAVAHRQLSAQQAAAGRGDPDVFAALCGQGLRFAGLLGLSDTPRPDAAGVLDGLVDRGIGIRLITGDHPVTATAIAGELGMPVAADQVISGPDWEALSRRAQEQAVQDRVVFARMSPEHKVQVVETLERLGQVCAMVGDGANDAAAIRVATVGIGVAARGSDPARTAADMMLLDGRIASLLDALDEGRQLWRRVQAAVAVLLGGNAGEVAFAIIGTALTGRSPLNTRQLLLVNMLTDALPAAALAVSRPHSDLRYIGRGPDRAALWRTVATRGTVTAGAAAAAWVLGSISGRQRRASTVALVALVGTQLGQTLIDSRSPLVVSTAVGSLLALGAIISTPVVSQLLGSTPLGPVGWAQALGTAAVATGVAAVAPRLMSPGARSEPADPSTIFTTPARSNTAYTSRNGTASSRARMSVNGSDPTEVKAMVNMVQAPQVQTPYPT
ncbi:MAG: P-type ATPase, translocating [Mycobacterium sp.]|nr:P-type ATPase, translocating [Mycobacterium sp.]